MLYSKTEIKQRTTQISFQKHKYDQQFSELQSLLISSRASKISLTKLRYQFQDVIAKLRQIVKKNTEQLDVLRYRADKLSQEGNDMTAGIRNIESLKEYFNELGKKVKSEHQKGQQRLNEKERWQLVNNHEDHSHYDQQSQLITSANSAKETKEIARQVLSSLQSQSGRLNSARQKMSEVIQNINFSGNLINLIKGRSKQDNKLIMMLSIGLVLQIILCIYVIRPLLRG